jgi:predicted Zn-dependent protease
MGATELAASQQAGGNEASTTVDSATMPLAVTESDSQPARDNEKAVVHIAHPHELGSATVEECSEVEIEMVRRLLANQRFDDARELVLQLRDTREGSDTLELLLSEIYIAESKISDATACVMALLGKNPDDPATLQALVKLYRTSGGVAKALEVRCRVVLYGTALAGISVLCMCVLIH